MGDSPTSSKGSSVTITAPDPAARPSPPQIHGVPRRHSTTPGFGLSRHSQMAREDSTPANEHSPLLQPQPIGELEQNDVQSDSTPPNEGSRNGSDESAEPELASSLYLFLLTVCMLGLQIAWSVEMSNGSPYLQNLGLSKDMLSLVWIAGPLSGVLVQPYVGAKSDRCTSRFGRRRPFIVGGGVATVISLLALAWAKEVIGGVFGLFHVAQKDTKIAVIVWAVIFIYILDFSINVIQAGIRAFIVDKTPTIQQDLANAWAVRLSGIGNIIGFLFGFLDLPDVYPFLGNTQFKVLCALASMLLILTIIISCYTVGEESGQVTAQRSNNTDLFAFFKDLRHSIRTLPKQVKAVCGVQFFAWIGWFPFRFYTSTYIGELYAGPIFAANPHMSKEMVERTWEEATRKGTWALFIFAITSFSASVILPFLIVDPSTQEINWYLFVPPRINRRRLSLAAGFLPTDLSSILTFAPLQHFADCWYGNTHSEAAARAEANHRSRNNDRPSARIIWPRISWLTLRRLWLLSHILTAALFFATVFVTNPAAATIVVALMGIPWAVTLWAPFALIASEVARIQSDYTVQTLSFLHSSPEHHPRPPATEPPQAGVVLGIHNVAIAAPQVISTLFCSVVFYVLQKPRGSAEDTSLMFVFWMSGVWMIFAAHRMSSVKEDIIDIVPALEA